VWHIGIQRAKPQSSRNSIIPHKGCIVETLPYHGFLRSAGCRVYALIYTLGYMRYGYMETILVQCMFHTKRVEFVDFEVVETLPYHGFLRSAGCRVYALIYTLGYMRYGYMETILVQCMFHTKRVEFVDFEVF
jgi:hypothetical protein